MAAAGARRPTLTPAAACCRCLPQLLVRNKADVNVETPDHGTPLHAAAGAGASNAVTQLLA